MPDNRIKVVKKINETATLTPEAIENRKQFILFVTDNLHCHYEDASWGTNPAAMYEKFSKLIKERAIEIKEEKILKKIDNC